MAIADKAGLKESWENRERTSKKRIKYQKGCQIFGDGSSIPINYLRAF